MKASDLNDAMQFIDDRFLDMADAPQKETKNMSVLKRKHSRIVLIAAIVATALLLMGAAVYTAWPQSSQTRFNPTQEIKEQAEKSGLSVIPRETKTGNEVLSATDQGITVTVVQTIADQFGARIVMRVEGFTPKQGMGIRPWVYGTPPTLGGSTVFWGSAGTSFFNGISWDPDGTATYTDGTPVRKYEDGSWEERYIREDGSMELVESFSFLDSSEQNLGKVIKLHYTGFGHTEYVSKAVDNYVKDVEGNWELEWVLTGAGEDASLHLTPNVEIGDTGTILLEAQIGQLGIRTVYQINRDWDGHDRAEQLPEGLYALKMKDGRVILMGGPTAGYVDKEKRIYFMEAEPFNSIIDPHQVQALLFHKGWEEGPDGKLSATYHEIPVE